MCRSHREDFSHALRRSFARGSPLLSTCASHVARKSGHPDVLELQGGFEDVETHHRLGRFSQACRRTRYRWRQSVDGTPLKTTHTFTQTRGWSAHSSVSDSPVYAMAKTCSEMWAVHKVVQLRPPACMAPERALHLLTVAQAGILFGVSVRAPSRSIARMPTRLTIAVGSCNPVKVESVRRSFTTSFPSNEIEITMHDIPSNVPDQPWNDQETRQGALNRALGCHAAHLSACGTAPDFAVGLEGGVVDEPLADLHPSTPGTCATVSCFAFMAILSMRAHDTASARWGIARTASFPLPTRLVQLMRGVDGRPAMELGAADDFVFGEVNSKQKGGTVAKATKGIIDRVW